MRWKSIKKLPPEHLMVLITDGKVMTCAARKQFLKNNPSAYYWMPYAHTGTEWDWDFTEKDITHWANLPDFPKKVT